MFISIASLDSASARVIESVYLKLNIKMQRPGVFSVPAQAAALPVKRTREDEKGIRCESGTIQSLCQRVFCKNRYTQRCIDTSDN